MPANDSAVATAHEVLHTGQDGGLQRKPGYQGDRWRKEKRDADMDWWVARKRRRLDTLHLVLDVTLIEDAQRKGHGEIWRRRRG